MSLPFLTPLEVPRDPAQPSDGDRVRQRVVALGDVGLEVVGERIHAGGGRDERGRPTVSSGSRMAALAIRNGEKITVLVPSITSTVLRPTSLPVPAVVGTWRMAAPPR